MSNNKQPEPGFLHECPRDAKTELSMGQEIVRRLERFTAALKDGDQQPLIWFDAEAAKLIPSGCAVLRRCTDEDGDIRFTAINFHRHDWIDWEREAAMGVSFAVLDYRYVKP